MAETENPRQNMTFPSNGHEAHGYLALPPSGSGPGLVVIQEWWGLTSHIADITDRFAAAGFVALAPDLYGGATTHDADEAGRLMGELPIAQATKDLAGAVAFYPVGNVPDDYAGLQAAVLAHFGEQDAFVPITAADDLADKIKAGNGQSPEIARYPAGHAFVNDQNLLGTHDREQAAKAWDRTVAFLHEHLD